MATPLEQIEDMKQWPSCAHISPPHMAGILEPLASARIIKLGVFSSTTEGEAAAAKIEVCSDETITAMLFAIDKGTYLTSVVIFQYVYKNMCTQMYVRYNYKAQRGIFFTDETRTTIKEVGDWA